MPKQIIPRLNYPIKLSEKWLRKDDKLRPEREKKRGILLYYSTKDKDLAVIKWDDCVSITTYHKDFIEIISDENINKELTYS